VRVSQLRRSVAHPGDAAAAAADNDDVAVDIPAEV